jgi:hypothetical protein
LLHSIAYTHSFDTTNRHVKRFFSSIKHVLPCIYCRRSFAQYTKELPIDTDNLFYYVYVIHNKVNEKLRGQGYHHKPDPSYQQVLRFYKKFVKSIDCAVGWHFLYCIAFEYPENCSERRKKGYTTFFNELAYLLPLPSMRETYCSYLTTHPIEDYLESPTLLSKWLHKLERLTRGDRCETYKIRCKMVDECRVKKCTGKTCRL